MKLEQKDLSEILETAIVAARLAGQRAMEEISYGRGGFSTRPPATVKNGTELVTETDARCQRIIMDRVKETFPDHGFIAEEGDHGKLFKRPPRGEPAVWWVIDPIDGTNNFAHGIPVFTVSIGVMFEGRPIAGVIFEPATDSMYSAVEGGESQVNGRRMLASQEEMSLLTSVGLDSHFGDHLPAGMCEIMKRTRFRNFGSTALQLAYVASGGLVGTVLCTPKLWDIAAGVILVQAAGAIFTDWRGDGLFPIDLDHYEGEPFQSLAAGEKVLPRLIELMHA
jgi:myo-inositol-1(or 4)-monophosphatase